MSYFFTVQSDIIQFRIIIGHNFDQLFRNYSQTKVKEEWRNLTLKWKNYRNERRLSYCYWL